MWGLAVSTTLQDSAPLAGLDGGGALRGLLGVTAVLGLLLLLAWLLRRGAFGRVGSRTPAAVRVETVVPLGERRSLMVVAVEGRRLLLGATTQSISFVTELQGPDQAFAKALTRAAGEPGGGEQ